MTPRYAYLCRLSAASAVSTSTDALPGVARHPVSDDAEPLAALMLDAYRDTIDYDGETLDDARSEISSYLGQQNDPPLLACSIPSQIPEQRQKRRTRRLGQCPFAAS